MDLSITCECQDFDVPLLKTVVIHSNLLLRFGSTLGVRIHCTIKVG